MKLFLQMLQAIETFRTFAINILQHFCCFARNFRLQPFVVF